MLQCTPHLIIDVLENIALLAMFCTILILSVFLMHEIKENVKSALKTTL